jgi:hypothetical protein
VSRLARQLTLCKEDASLEKLRLMFFLGAVRSSREVKDPTFPVGINPSHDLWSSRNLTQAREPHQKSATLSPPAAPICNIDHTNSVRRLSSPFTAHMSLQQFTAKRDGYNDIGEYREAKSGITILVQLISSAFVQCGRSKANLYD